MKEISVVIPIFNAAEWIEETVGRTEYAIQNAGIKRYEIIIVNDGSTDNIVDIVQALQKKNKKIRFFSHKNSGRFITRKVGVEKAQYDRILFVDARTWIDEEALAYLSKQMVSHPERKVWNAHINVEKKGNIIARFGDVITLLGWRRYFKKPRLTSFGLKDFDYYPKGTGLFSVPTRVIKEAIEWFEKNTTDVKNSSDDTLLIRHIAESERVWLSPQYSGSYFARTTLPAFVKHTYNRGKFFVDGFLRPGTRFFCPLIAVLAISVIATLILLTIIFTNPFALLNVIILAVFALICMNLLLLILNIGIKDSLSFTALAPLFCCVYLAGIWSAVFKQHISSSIVGGLTRQRRFLGGSILEYILVALVGFFLTCYSMDFLQFTGINHKIFTNGPSDATSGFVWLNYADPGINPVLGDTDFSNYPVGESLGGLYFVTYILLWIPIRVLSFLFGPITGINIMTTLGYVLSFSGMYWLMKRLTKSVPVALLAGYSLAFFPYAIAKGTAHMAYIFSIVFVAILAAFIYLWKKPSWKSAALFACAIAASFYFDGYHLLMTPVMVIGLVIAGAAALLMTSSSRAHDLKRYLKYLCLSALVTVLLSLPVLLVGTVFSKDINSALGSTRSPIAKEIPFYRSWPIDFVIPAKKNPFFFNNSDYNNIQDYRDSRSDALSNTSFIGYAVIILVVVGLTIFFLWLIVRNTKIKYLSSLSSFSKSQKQMFILLSLITMVCGLVFVSFMLSPSITIHGVTISLPGALFIKYDVGLWRNMSRFSEPLQVVLVVFALYVLWLFLKNSKYLKNKSKRFQMIATTTLCFVLFVGTFVTYANNENLPVYDTRKQGAALEWLSRQDDIQSVVYLPVVDPLDELSSNYSAMQFTTLKKMVNIKNPEHRVNANVLGSMENSETIDWLRLRGADAAIVFYQDKVCPAVSWGYAVKHDEGWKMCVYRISKEEDRLPDNYFAIFFSGVDATPNYNKNQKNTYRLNSDEVKIKVTDNRFNPTHDNSSALLLSAHLVNWNYANDKTDGRWMVLQNGKQIASGELMYGEADIRVHVSAGSEVTLLLDRKNKGNDLLLQNLDIDAV